ncbi:MAG TPA: hypothetical protein P5057_05170 [Acidobacteriota bacterium]|nr:hypothetical protein [Acidobacteriota bacterium]
MTRRIVWLGAAILLVLGVYQWSLDPRVATLLEGPKQRGRPLGFLEELPPVSVPETESSKGKRKLVPPTPDTREGGFPTEERNPRDSERVVVNQVENSVVAKTLLQILQAQGLADGISLAVSDQEIKVFGEVRDRATLDRIVSVLERGRETRRIDLEAIAITGSPPAEQETPLQQGGSG